MQTDSTMRDPAGPVMDPPSNGGAIHADVAKRDSAERDSAERDSARAEAVLDAVHRIATGLFSRPGVDDLLSDALTAALESVSAEGGTIFLHDPRDDTLVFRHVVGGAGHSLVGVRIKSDQGLAGAVFRSGQPVVTGDAASDHRHVDVAAGFHTQAMVTVPLRSLGGRTIGVLQVLNKSDGGCFSQGHDLVVLETLASLIAAAIENASQAERERKAAVADAVGDIAHDIKNMMTPVESWGSTLELIAADSLAALNRLQEAHPELSAEIASARELFDFLPDALEGIRDGAQQVKDRGAEIADALKGNVRTPIFVTEDIAKTLSRVCRTLEPAANARGVRILLEGRCRPFPHDRTHLFNAVYNLVNNAIPYVPSGRSIRVVVSEVDRSAEIAVIDSGQGMPEAVRASLFTDRTISTTVGGTGLGTQIVARVAHAHNGSVSVESELGKGSTFRLRLPLERES